MIARKVEWSMKMTEKHANEAKLNKWFLAYEFVYIGVCILCRFLVQLEIWNENILMGILSGISALLIVIAATRRIRHAQYKYMPNLFVMAFFTAMVFIWCFRGVF